MKVQKNHDIFRKIIAVDILRMTELQKILTFYSRDYTHTHTHTHACIRNKAMWKEKGTEMLIICMQTNKKSRQNKQIFCIKMLPSTFWKFIQKAFVSENRTAKENWVKNKVKYQINSYPNKKTKSEKRRNEKTFKTTKLGSSKCQVRNECDKRRTQQIWMRQTL